MNLTIHRNAMLDALERLMPLVPTRPLNPIEGQIRLAVDGGDVIAEVTDGRIRARVRVMDTPLSGAGYDIFPAYRLDAFVKAMPKNDLEITVDDRMASVRSVVVGDYRTMFSLPLLPDPDQFSEFPAVTALPSLGQFSRRALTDAIDRVQFAMGGPSAKENMRMIQILDGVASAFSGYRAQQVLVDEDHTGEILLVDYVVEPLLRFLKHEDENAQVTVYRTNTLPAQYVFATRPADKPDSEFSTMFACTVPVAEFTDLTNVKRISDEQYDASGKINVSAQVFENAIEAARLQTTKDDLSVNFDLTSPVRVHSSTDNDNTFETYLPGSTFKGEEEGRTITASIDDLLGLIAAGNEEQIDIYVSPVAYARGQTMPMIQTRAVGKSGVLAFGIVAQANN